MATPAKITVPREAPVLRANNTTVSTATIAPPKAAREIAHPESAPAAQHAVTASPAPALTPMVLGEASLLPNNFCKTHSAHDSAAPESRQAAVRGRREYQKCIPQYRWGRLELPAKACAKTDSPRPGTNSKARLPGKGPSQGKNTNFVSYAFSRISSKIAYASPQRLLGFRLNRFFSMKYTRLFLTAVNLFQAGCSIKYCCTYSFIPSSSSPR